MVVTVRQTAPQFSSTALLPNGEFDEVSLAKYKGRYVLLFFYPLDFTFVCPTEICAFSDRAQDFRELNCEVLGCSIDSKYSHLAWTELPRTEGGIGSMNIPLISDITKSISKDYGVLIENTADGDCGVALRGLFIIDGKGVVRHVRWICINMYLM